MRLPAAWSGFLRALTAHPVGFVGVLLTTTSFVLFAALFGLEVLGLQENPYVGILTFLVLPGLFLFGLVLIPIGRFLRARQERRGVVVDLTEAEQQRRVILFLLLTIGNLIVLSVAAYEGVHFTDSNAFCGEVCHTVMEPEFTAYQGSPHSRVPCVSCHIGPGADFFVRYKINGISQVFAVLFDTYDRPIPTPVENLRPARETCEQCHWPERFHGDKFLVKTRYEDDEANTALKTVMVLKVGGGGAESGYPSGIHWHTSAENRVTYVATDKKREEIVWVEVERPNGERTVYTKGGEEIPDSVLARGEERLLDCVDCHNRPTHVYDSPGGGLDRAFTAGKLDAALPGLKSVGLDLLTRGYESKEAALAEIPAELERYYREYHSEMFEKHGASVRAAGEEIRRLYASNVFPSMNIAWNTYPSHLGHEENRGCFRCHSGEHLSAEGEEIDSSCETCHSILAIEEEDPAVLHMLLGE
ncbi:MAG: NapC/NirT family cytochrome c [Candidatus Eisenbacteria bacterium]